MKVLKFGGTSVGSAQRIEKVLEIIQTQAKSGEKMAVVFSAFGKVTDLLIEMGQRASEGDESYKEIFSEIEGISIQTADELISLKKRSQVLTQIKVLLKDLEEVVYGVFLIKELTAKTLDYVMSFGERISAFVISASLADQGLDNQFVDTRKIIKTNNQFGHALVDFEQTGQNIKHLLSSEQQVFIITGFIASTVKNETTTLGRGGSDYSASLFGAIADAREIEIWTDVDGVMTADPRKVKNAFPIPQLTYEEAMELSHFGAKVIHPPTMQPALDKNIPIRIKNTFNSQFTGTLISSATTQNGFSIRGISSIDAVALLQIQGSGMVGISGVAQRIFSALAKEKINIIMISQASSEHSICLAILPEFAEQAKTALDTELKYEIHYGHVNEVVIESDMAIIAVVGEKMRHTKGIAGKVFQTLAKNSVNISAIAQGSSELNISMVVAAEDEAKALNAIHATFFDKQSDNVHLFLLGTGLVGTALLNQIRDKISRDTENNAQQLQVSGLANSRKMAIDAQGIGLEKWQDILQNSTQKSEMHKFVAQIKSLNLANSIFVDCTASAVPVENYEELLSAGISIVAANKIATSRSQEKYDTLKKIEQDSSAKFIYETNVGAALPVISTIKNIVSGNDKIDRLEGILSGTLSYIFNTFDATVPFSEVVRIAKEKGFTEPDPRLDLNGMDVARKLLILIRESGQPFEPEQIMIEPFLPEGALNAKSVEDFIHILQKHDVHFEKMYKQAKSKNKVLRFVAVYEDGQAKISLTSVAKSHPFFIMEGSDNVLAIYTNYYKDQPLVIKGAGAGADVTAAGVFADVMRIADNFL